MTDVLADRGEFRLLREVVIPTLSAGMLAAPLGDDCCAVTLGQGAGHLILTADAAPRPLVWEIGHSCYRTWGWYSVLINVSDLAAAGARPLAFTSSVEAPDSMAVESFRDFFEGMAEACAALKIPNAGGNIRSAPRFECHGTAVGLVQKRKPLTRAGCKPGDRIVVIGPCGRFIVTYLRAKADGFKHLTAEENNVLLRPRPRTQEMLLLSRADVVSSATDNSDGILGCLANIAERSGCGIEINLSDSLIPQSVRDAAYTHRLNPWNLMFFWGDWQMVMSVKRRAWDRFVSVTKRRRIEFMDLGVAIDKQGIYARTNGKGQRLRVVRNENFTSCSFNSSVSDHVEWLLRTDIFESE